MMLMILVMTMMILIDLIILIMMFNNDFYDDRNDMLTMIKMMLLTHTEYSINAGIVATVAHCKPVKHKEHDVDVLPAGEKILL